MYWLVYLMITDYFPLKAHTLHIMVFDYQDFVASASRCVCTCLCPCKYTKTCYLSLSKLERYQCSQCLKWYSEELGLGVLENLTLVTVVVVLDVNRHVAQQAALPMDEVVMWDLPSTPAMCPCAYHSRSPTAQACYWRYSCDGFSDLFQSKWTQLIHFYSWSGWCNSLGLKYKSLCQQIEGTATPAGLHSLFQTDSSCHFPQPSCIQGKMHDHGLPAALPALYQHLLSRHLATR